MLESLSPVKKSNICMAVAAIGNLHCFAGGMVEYLLHIQFVRLDN